MLDFANPYLLILLLAVPAVWALYELSRMALRRKLKRFGNIRLLTPLMPEASKYKAPVKITLQLLALAAIVMILVRPRFGEKDQTRQVAGIEAVVCFDVSNSMLAQSTDDPKSTSRLKRAKLLLDKLIDRMDNDRVGLVIFAQEPKMKLPMTTDFYSAKMFLNDLEPSMIRAQGTNIGSAMNMSMQAFSQKKDVHKSIILITDAEDHDGKAVEIAKQAADAGIQVNVIGVGTSKGARIPLQPGSKEYLRDMDGNEVITKVDQEAAAQIAAAGKGIYVNGADPDALDKLSEQLEKLGKSDFKEVKYKTSAEQFPLFAWLALLLLVADIFVLHRKSAWLRDVNLFTRSSRKAGASAKGGASGTDAK